MDWNDHTAICRVYDTFVILKYAKLAARWNIGKFRQAVVRAATLHSNPAGDDQYSFRHGLSLAQIPDAQHLCRNVIRGAAEDFPMAGHWPLGCRWAAAWESVQPAEFLQSPRRIHRIPVPLRRPLRCHASSMHPDESQRERRGHRPSDNDKSAHV